MASLVGAECWNPGGLQIRVSFFLLFQPGNLSIFITPTSPLLGKGGNVVFFKKKNPISHLCGDRASSQTSTQETQETGYSCSWYIASKHFIKVFEWSNYLQVGRFLRSSRALFFLYLVLWPDTTQGWVYLAVIESNNRGKISVIIIFLILSVIIAKGKVKPRQLVYKQQKLMCCLHCHRIVYHNDTCSICTFTRTCIHRLKEQQN